MSHPCKQTLGFGSDGGRHRYRPARCQVEEQRGNKDRGDHFAAGRIHDVMHQVIDLVAQREHATADLHRRAGAAVEIRSGMLALSDKVYHLVHYVVDSASGEVITTILVAALFFDLAARRSVPMPAAVRAEAQRLLAGV